MGAEEAEAPPWRARMWPVCGFRGWRSPWQDRAEEGLGSSPRRHLQLEFATGLPGWGGRRRIIRGGGHRRARVLGVRGQVHVP